MFEELKNKVEAASVDADKFYKEGNAAAGTRLRNAMLEIGKLTKDIRKDVSSIKDAKKA